jgi:UDP-MurNAc hydroxylase
VVLLLLDLFYKMKIQYIASACVLIESKGVKILTDPWLTEGEYYGSWYHYPPLEYPGGYFDDIDYIYVSHIHPDHFSKATFSQLGRQVPVLIHSYESKFLKDNIERLGFRVMELSHNVRTHLKNEVHINVLAADNCNPELCARFFGCGLVESKYGSTQIDSMGVIDDGQFVVVNTNDCPYDLSKSSLELIKSQYPTIDFLLTGYGGAGPYPQCFRMESDRKVRAAAEKKEQFLQYGIQYIHELQPRYVMPFAGTYVLGGKLASLNDSRGLPEIEDAADYFGEKANAGVVLLNRFNFFDLEKDQASNPYVKTDLEAKRRYIQDVLAVKQLAYETVEIQEYWRTHIAEIKELIFLAYQRFEGKRHEIGFVSTTMTLLYLGPDCWCSISNHGEGITYINSKKKDTLEQYVSYKVDIRLLHQILKGPRYAHWNNAEIGSHIEFERKPDIFERGLHYCMNFFHA